MDNSTYRSMDNSTYRKYLKAFNFSPATYAEIAIHLEKYGVKGMYHVQVNEVDIVTVLSPTPQIKIFWCCRCYRVRGDGSAENEHWHALVHFEDDRSRIALMGKVSSHPTSAFKKILCPDQALGVLKYICCKSDRGIPVVVPHTHYARSVDNKLRLLHTRGVHCANIRGEIYDAVTLHVSPAWLKENNYLGVSQEKKELHNREICRCRRGKIFKQEIWRS